MSTPEQIDQYISSQPEPKRSDLHALHQLLLRLLPGCKLWFEDGKNSDGKTVSNPSVGYGEYTIQYANGSSRKFYQVGISANTTGLSVYLMGLKDKNYLAQHFAKVLGKASVTGYCIKFKSLQGIDTDVLAEAIRYAVAATSDN